MSTRWEALSVHLLVNIQRTRFCGELVNDKRHQEVRLSFRLYGIYLEALHTGGLNLVHVKTRPHMKDFGIFTAVKIYAVDL